MTERLERTRIFRHGDVTHAHPRRVVLHSVSASRRGDSTPPATWKSRAPRTPGMISLGVAVAVLAGPAGRTRPPRHGVRRGAPHRRPGRARLTRWRGAGGRWFTDPRASCLGRAPSCLHGRRRPGGQCRRHQPRRGDRRVAPRGGETRLVARRSQQPVAARAGRQAAHGVLLPSRRRARCSTGWRAAPRACPSEPSAGSRCRVGSGARTRSRCSPGRSARACTSSSAAGTGCPSSAPATTAATGRRRRR